MVIEGSTLTFPKLVFEVAGTDLPIMYVYEMSEE